MSERDVTQLPPEVNSNPSPSITPLSHTDDSRDPEKQSTGGKTEKQSGIRLPPPEGYYRNGTTGKMIPAEYTAQEAVRTLLRYLGEDPDRDGLLGTPRRVLRAWREITRGNRGLTAEEILSTTFAVSCDEMVVVRGIPFNSTCEHHILPFSGTAHIGYLPTDRVVGLSKLARLVDCFSLRLQIQERLTTQIANAIAEHLSTKGVGVVLEASHSCMTCRGVTKPGAMMVTSCCLGVFREHQAARAEFFNMIRG